MKKRFTEEQIVRILQEARDGMATADVYRKYSICEQPFYRWKKRYGDLQASEVARLKALERENEELKKIVAERALDGRRFRCLTVVDEFTRESLAIVISRSLTSDDVIRALDELIRKRGRPDCLRSDQGPEFITRAVRDWLDERAIGTYYIDPGSPWQNAYGESFNSIFRTTCLDRWAFESVREARAVVESWRSEYNGIRPHGSLRGRSPAQFGKDWASARREVSTELQVGNS